MPRIEIAKEEYFAETFAIHRENYPRIAEVLADVEWKIHRNFTQFPIAETIGKIEIRVLRTDESENPLLPAFELAYYYSLQDGKVHLMAVRPILEDEA